MQDDNLYVTTPLWPSVGVKPNTSKVGDLESSGTLECLEFDNKAQNTSHWSVLGVIGKVLKRKYRKWPRIGHLDICSPSYGQKKGWESDLVANRLCSRELWTPKVPGLHPGQFRDNFRTPTWESREKVTFGHGCRGESQSILLGVRWWLTPKSGPWCVLWSKVPVACPHTQGCFRNVN
jgi:hypothetical protein